MNEEEQRQLPTAVANEGKEPREAQALGESMRVLGGVPAGMPGTLGGVAVLLVLVGLLCELYAGRGAEGSWQNVLFVVVLCVLVGAMVFGHVSLARRSGVRIISLSMLIFFGAHAVLLPLLCMLPEVILRPTAPFLGLVYALLMLWYGSHYASGVLVAAACALVFAGVLAIPFCLQLGAFAAGIVLILVGGCLLYASFYLHRIRARHLARLTLAKKRRDINRASASAEEVR